MKNLSLILFLSAALFGLMALMPEGPQQKRKFVTAVDSEGRRPASFDDLSIKNPAAGEPSDDGLTQGLHREFRETLGKNPASGVEIAREIVFTHELDARFRLQVLRELKSHQFIVPEVTLLVNEIILHSTSPALFEEALVMKSALMGEEEFSDLLSALARKKGSPEYRAILEDLKSRRRTDTT